MNPIRQKIKKYKTKESHKFIILLIIIKILFFRNIAFSASLKDLATIDENTPLYSSEKIYICLGYSDDFYIFYKNLIGFLLNREAKRHGREWVINDIKRKKSFVIHIISDIESVKNALMTKNSHVLIRGHANFGLGPFFYKDPEEFRKNEKEIVNTILNPVFYRSNIKYPVTKVAKIDEIKNEQWNNKNSVLKKIKHIDDVRRLNLSSRWVDIPIRYLRTWNNLTDWWPVYRNGSSCVASYAFDKPNAPPPFNYYLKYRIPGDAKYHMILGRDGKPIERFPLSKKKAWFSEAVDTPDPKDLSQRNYYIINTKVKENYLKKTGNWKEMNKLPGYFGENYIKAGYGPSEKSAEWHFQIPMKGEYFIYIWVPPAINTEEEIIYNYTLYQKADCTELQVKDKIGSDSVPEIEDVQCRKHSIKSNQLNESSSINLKDTNMSSLILNIKPQEASCWSKLGLFKLKPGKYVLKLNCQEIASDIIVDALKIVHSDNPKDLLTPFFFSNKKHANVNEVISFINNSKGEIDTYKWMFGDGKQEVTKNPYVWHQYSDPGLYDVSLEITDYMKRRRVKTKKKYISVGDRSESFQLEFSAQPNTGLVPFKVSFTDRSIGRIKRRMWDFGDGSMSTEKNPDHSYSKSGNYTICLTAWDDLGRKQQIVKEKYIRANIFNLTIDNMDYPKNHYKYYTIIDTGRQWNNISKRHQYARLFFDSCNVERYFLESISHGIVFYTVKDSDAYGIFPYLNAYMKGKNNKEILSDLNLFMPSTYSYKNFTIENNSSSK